MNDLPLPDRGRMLSKLATTLATLPTDRPPTWRLGEAMRRMLEADGVAFTVEYLSNSRVTVCATDDVAETLESLQEVAGEGPGYEAARTGMMVIAELDGDADQRWPMLTQALEEKYGPLKMYAVPLHANGDLAGVATLHTGPNRSLAEPPDRIAFLANAVGAALVTDAADHPEGHLQPGEGWGARSLVHQATGMVMAQVRLTPEDALALLRGHAYAMATDINDVAARIVDRSIDFLNFDVEGD